MTVLEIALLALAVLGAAWGAVLVHEAGHYLAGRLLGVPAESIRIRMERPPHVALHRSGRWFSPDEPGYSAVFALYNDSVMAAWLFIAAGIVVETAVALVLVMIFFAAGSLPLVIAGASTGVLIAYLLADVVMSKGRGLPYGDFTAMRRIYPAASIATIGVAVVLRAVAIAASLPV